MTYLHDMTYIEYQSYKTYQIDITYIAYQLYIKYLAQERYFPFYYIEGNFLYISRFFVYVLFLPIYNRMKYTTAYAATF